MKGYYKNPKATADAMAGDWYKTGDLGYYTEDGKQDKFNRKLWKNSWISWKELIVNYYML